MFFQLYYKRIIQDFDFWSGCSRVFLLFCTECCRSWYDLVRFIIKYGWMSGHGEAQRLLGFWDCQHYGQHCSLSRPMQVSMERMLGTNNAGFDDNAFFFWMDRTDQFMICEFLFALQYMYSESLVSSSAFDKVKFQDHLLVGISLEPWSSPTLEYTGIRQESKWVPVSHHQT